VLLRELHIYSEAASIIRGGTIADEVDDSIELQVGNNDDASP